MTGDIGRERANKGSIIKLFGVVMIFLGGLNAMLSWRGGLPATTFADTFYIWLMGGGLLLYAVGAIRHTRQLDEVRHKPGG